MPSTYRAARRARSAGSFDPETDRGLGRRRRLLRRQQPRRRAVEGQGHLDLARRPAVRDQQGDRREGVGAQDRRPGDWRDADARAAGRSATSRSSAPPAANTASAASSTAPTSTPASSSGAPTRSRAPASPATRPGRTARSAGSTAAARSGRPRPTIRRSDTFYQGIGNAGPDYDRRIPARRQQMGRERARAQPRRRQDQVGLPVHAQRPLRLRRNLRAPDHQRQGQRRGPQARRARGAQRLLLCARPDQRLVRDRQAICRSADLDHRARSQDRQAAQLRSHQGRADLRARQPRHARPGPSRTCPSNGGGKNWQPSAYNPSSACSIMPTIEGCNSITTGRAEELCRPGRHA